MRKNALTKREVKADAYFICPLLQELHSKLFKPTGEHDVYGMAAKRRQTLWQQQHIIEFHYKIFINIDDRENEQHILCMSRYVFNRTKLRKWQTF